MTYKIDLVDKDFDVSESLTHLQQVEAYRKLFVRLTEAEKDIKQTKEKAKEDKDTKIYFEADMELERITPYWVPFAIASARADAYKKEGYKLADLKGNFEPARAEIKEDDGDGTVDQTDPLVTLFMILFEALIDSWMDKLTERFNELMEEDASINDYIEAGVQLIPGMRMLQDFRDLIIPEGNNHEVSKILRDPIKRPIELIQNIRDGFFGEDNNNELVAYLRDPINKPIKTVVKLIEKLPKKVRIVIKIKPLKMPKLSWPKLF